MHYDAIIIGAGIAGASTAYFLKEAGLSVLVLEKNTICSGGSYPAGAFLSPKISKPSPYKTYLNDAFLFSTTFYKTNFQDLFLQCGLKKIPLDLEDIKKCQSYEPYIDIPYSKDNDNYFFPDAGIINPVKICHTLFKETEVKEQYHIKKITYDQKWIVDNFTCENLILATGNDKLPIHIPYIKTKNIAGYRYDVSFDGYEKLKFNTHKDLSISAYHDEVVAIGATHIKLGEVEDLDLQARHDSFELLKKAKKLLDMQNLKILKTYTGYRNSTFDYFPIVGKLINADTTLETYPYIKNGTKVPTEKYHMHKGLYIHNALGSRGFVYAPYNAKILCQLLVNDKAVQERLSPVRLFKKWSTKLS